MWKGFASVAKEVKERIDASSSTGGLGPLQGTGLRCSLLGSGKGAILREMDNGFHPNYLGEDL